jgi:hypothetical protein
MTARKTVRQANKVPDFALMQNRMADAMWALPQWLPDNVLEDYIPALAEKYAYMRFDRLFDAKPLTEKQIRSKLLKIKKQSEALLISVMTLEGPASDALYQTIAESDRLPEIACLIPPSMMESHPHRPTLGELMAYLQRLADAASSPIIPWDAVKKRKGPDLNILPREIAQAAARDFHGLAGKPPTLSKNRHEFPLFLDAVFKALDIQSSVADHIVEAVQWWSSTHPRGEVLQHVEPIVGK